MGIRGLLPQLKSIMLPLNIRELQGCCVAIDTYSWLHKGAVYCSTQLCKSIPTSSCELSLLGRYPVVKLVTRSHYLSCARNLLAIDTYSWLYKGAVYCSTQLCKSVPTSRHIEYCMDRVNLLRHYGVKPILVFDGGHLPMKREQENKRARSRKEYLARAIEHESSGNSYAAYECYRRAVDISPAIASDLIQVLKHEGISYIVAPYEADAQMAFLATTNQVEAVITEDSDLIAFGCPRIIYKMNKYGQGVEFQYQRLAHNKDLSFIGFSSDMLLEMCILSGCDYLPSLPGVGLKTAHALISKFETYQKVIKHLRSSSVPIPPFYEESFRKAVWTFRYQRVYDSNKQDIVHLSDISEPIEGEDLDFLGPLMPRLIAKAIAEGEVDPISKIPFKGFITETSSKKIVRSSYFKNKAKRTTEIDVNKTRLIIDRYFGTAKSEELMPITDLFGNGCNEEMIVKRKASPNQIYLGLKDHAEHKLARIEKYPEVTSLSATDRGTETKPDEKSGCEISYTSKFVRHIREIRGQFMSVISS